MKGIYKDDKLEGWGIQTVMDGTFKGEFEEGRTSGFGEFLRNKGAIYYGNWIDSIQFGIGYEVWGDNSRYEGEYNNGVKEGIGSFYSDGICMYCGEWKNNNMEGFGIYNYTDGRKYIGEWKLNKMEGYGELYMKEGKKYFGFFKDEKKNGFGIYYFLDNNFYVGFWKEGKQHGLGKYIKNKTVKYGLWNSGKKEKFFNKEEDFEDSFDENDEKYSTFFKWDINKLKQFLYFEGYEENKNEKNFDKKNSVSESENSDEFKNIGKKNNGNNNVKNSDDEDEEEEKNDDLL